MAQQTKAQKTKVEQKKVDTFKSSNRKHGFYASDMELSKLKKIKDDVFEIPAHIVLWKDSQKEQEFDGTIVMKNCNVGDALEIELNENKPTKYAITSQIWYALNRTPSKFKRHRENIEIAKDGKVIAKSDGNGSLIPVK